MSTFSAKIPPKYKEAVKLSETQCLLKSVDKQDLNIRIDADKSSKESLKSLVNKAYCSKSNSSSQAKINITKCGNIHGSSGTIKKFSASKEKPVSITSFQSKELPQKLIHAIPKETQQPQHIRVESHKNVVPLFYDKLIQSNKAAESSAEKKSNQKQEKSPTIDNPKLTFSSSYSKLNVQPIKKAIPIKSNVIIHKRALSLISKYSEITKNLQKCNQSTNQSNSSLSISNTSCKESKELLEVQSTENSSKQNLSSILKTDKPNTIVVNTKQALPREDCSLSLRPLERIDMIISNIQSKMQCFKKEMDEVESKENRPRIMRGLYNKDCLSDLYIFYYSRQKVTIKDLLNIISIDYYQGFDKSGKDCISNEINTQSNERTAKYAECFDYIKYTIGQIRESCNKVADIQTESVKYGIPDGIANPSESITINEMKQQIKEGCHKPKTRIKTKYKSWNEKYIATLISKLGTIKEEMDESKISSKEASLNDCDEMKDLTKEKVSKEIKTISLEGLNRGMMISFDKDRFIQLSSPNSQKKDKNQVFKEIREKSKDLKSKMNKDIIIYSQESTIDTPQNRKINSMPTSQLDTDEHQTSESSGHTNTTNILQLELSKPMIKIPFQSQGKINENSEAESKQKPKIGDKEVEAKACLIF